MSGHSKWSNIKHKKAATDAKRGAAFTKVARLIAAAVKQGGPDPEMNPTLRLALEKGRAVNMPKDNVERAIKKASGDGDTVSYVELLFEGYAQGGIAIVVEALTDNRNRTTPEVRKIFEKGGGNLGEMGCVNWMFKKVGAITVATAGKSEDELMEIALECGADDIEVAEDTAEVTTSLEDFTSTMEGLRNTGLEASGEITCVADNTIGVDANIARKVLKLVDLLEDHEDTQNVYTNMDLSEEVQKVLEQD